MSDRIRAKLAPNAVSIINECLDFDYREAVAIAKAKYFYEHIDANPEAQRIFNKYTGAVQPTDYLNEAYINNIKTIDVFFPLHLFVNEFLNIQTAYQFGVLCEINSYLKRIVPTKVKKAKAIGTFEREVLEVDKEDDEELGADTSDGDADDGNAMVEDNSVYAPQDDDGQGEGQASTIRRLALAETSGLFRLKHMNKLYIFKKGEERLRALDVQDNRIVFDVVAMYKNL